MLLGGACHAVWAQADPPATAQGTDMVGTLRNPQHSVFAAFPEATGYRTIVRRVDRNARGAIEAVLPFRLHFHELGPHGLYVAQRGVKPVGLLYVRAEESEWGFAEIVWAMTLDGHIVGFQLQRCRSRSLLALRNTEFSRSLRGRDFDRLRGWLDGEGELRERPRGVPGGRLDLASAVVRSAMKALAVTEVVWGREVVKLADLNMGFDAFPEADRFRRLIPAPPRQPRRSDAKPRASTRVVQAFDARGALLGYAARTESPVDGGMLGLRWRLRPDGRVASVFPTTDWPGSAVRAACRDLVGRQLPGVAPRQDPVLGAAARLRAALSPAREAAPR